MRNQEKQTDAEPVRRKILRKEITHRLRHYLPGLYDYVPAFAEAHGGMVFTEYLSELAVRAVEETERPAGTVSRVVYIARGEDAVGRAADLLGQAIDERDEDESEMMVVAGVKATCQKYAQDAGYKLTPEELDELVSIVEIDELPARQVKVRRRRKPTEV